MGSNHPAISIILLRCRLCFCLTWRPVGCTVLSPTYYCLTLHFVAWLPGREQQACRGFPTALFLVIPAMGRAQVLSLAFPLPSEFLTIHHAEKSSFSIFKPNHPLLRKEAGQILHNGIYHPLPRRLGQISPGRDRPDQTRVGEAYGNRTTYWVHTYRSWAVRMKGAPNPPTSTTHSLILFSPQRLDKRSSKAGLYDVSSITVMFSRSRKSRRRHSNQAVFSKSRAAERPCDNPW